jgi:hypothetical protein
MYAVDFGFCVKRNATDVPIERERYPTKINSRNCDRNTSRRSFILFERKVRKRKKKEKRIFSHLEKEDEENSPQHHSKKPETRNYTSMSNSDVIALV